MKKTLSIALLLIIVLIGAALFSLLYVGQPQMGSQQTAPTRIADTNEVLGTQDTAEQLRLDLTAQIDGQTALELLETSAKVETQDFGAAGQFVTSINGVESDAKNYWAFYLNGQYAQEGASHTILAAGDIISFVYEEIILDN